MENLTENKNEILIKELTKIERRDGILTPHAVVKEAAKSSSPLHDYFTWDNSKAAAAYRLWEARMIIRSAVLVRDDTASSVRYFQSVVSKVAIQGEEPEDSRFYISTERALADKTLRQQVLARAKQEAQDWADKYQDLKELAHIIAAIKKST
jgi:hypothetical protein